MKFMVRPELPTASVGSSQAPPAAVDNSAPYASRPESTYKSGKVVQTNGATSLVIEIDVLVKRLLFKEYARHHYYGRRKMVVYLGRCAHWVISTRVQRLIPSMGLAAIALGPNTSWAHPQHKVYPYLLRGVAVVRPNQVWTRTSPT